MHQGTQRQYPQVELAIDRLFKSIPSFGVDALDLVGRGLKTFRYIVHGHLRDSGCLLRFDKSSEHKLAFVISYDMAIYAYLDWDHPLELKMDSIKGMPIPRRGVRVFILKRMPAL